MYILPDSNYKTLRKYHWYNFAGTEYGTSETLLFSFIKPKFKVN